MQAALARRCVVGVLLLVVVAALAGVGHADDCSGPTNDFPISTKDPVLVKAVTNGKLYLTTDDFTGNSLRVMHLYGSAYDMGYAQAALLGQEIVTMVAEFEQYIEDQIGQYLPNMPKDIRKIVEKDGALAALQFTVELTRNHTPQHFFDEARGIADGLNGAVSYDDLYRIQMFPELIKAACSMFGAWGPAVAETHGTLYQLRALDFGMDSPLVNYAILAVYHPTDGFPFISMTWVGFIGSVTTFNGVVGMSEKVWLHYNETSSRAGIPFHFLIRDVGQYDRTIDDALNRMISVERTCSVFLGVGSSHENTFRAVEYAHEFIRIYDDANFPAYPPVHPLMEGLVFLDKHTQPSDDPCLGGLLQQYYGSITPEITIKNILGPFGTGDLHAAMYDFNASLMYVSFAGQAYNATGHAIEDQPVAPSYSRPWMRFDAAKLLATTQ